MRGQSPPKRSYRSVVAYMRIASIRRGPGYRAQQEIAPFSGLEEIAGQLLHLPPELLDPGLVHQGAAIETDLQGHIPLLAPGPDQAPVPELVADTEVGNPGHADALQHHPLEAFGHGGLVDGAQAQAQGVVLEQHAHAAAQEGALGVGEVGNRFAPLQRKARPALLVRQAHRSILTWPMEKEGNTSWSSCMLA